MRRLLAMRRSPLGSATGSQTSGSRTPRGQGTLLEPEFGKDSSPQPSPLEAEREKAGAQSVCDSPAIETRQFPVGETPAFPSNAAFSLIELLITVAIILILSTLYFGPNTAGKQQALKRACQKNLEKIYVSMEIYANEHGGQFPEKPGARTSEEALDVLVPKYTSDPTPFICPGSKDGPLSAGSSLRGQTISYAYYMGRQLTNSAMVLLSDRQIDTLPKSAGQAVFSTNGKPPGNNHRKFGGNFLFCDGHTEMSSALAAFALPVTNGEVLLNP